MAPPTYTDAFSPPDAFLALPVSEQGMQLLRYLVDTGEDHPNREPWLSQHAAADNFDAPGKGRLLASAFAEAWNWLEMHGLIAPAPDGKAKDGIFIITKLGRSTAADPDGLRRFRAVRRADLELHPELVKVRPQLELGEFDFAISRAMLSIEIRVRALAGLGDELIGKDLMYAAFGDGKPLCVLGNLPAERHGVAGLFAGAMAFLRNPTNHRSVGVGAEKASEVVIFASLLHRLLDQVEARLTPDEMDIQLPE